MTATTAFHHECMPRKTSRKATAILVWIAFMTIINASVSVEEEHAHAHDHDASTTTTTKPEAASPLSWKELIRRGTANVEWCENVLAKHAHHDWIAEYYNTWSNLVFCIVALVGLHRVLRRTNTNVVLQNKTPFVVAEGILFGVGIGSWFFHSHQSRLAQWSDEIPMSLLLMAQLHCLDGLHPYATLTFMVHHVFVASFWILYMYTNIYAIFEHGFTVQIILLTAFSFDIGRRLHHSQIKWAASLGLLLLAKGIWDIERQRYARGDCQLPLTLWLHPVWHVGASISHYFAMSNNADLQHVGALQQQQQEDVSVKKKN